ncbi:MAG: ubiquinol-cytochrome c reductase iron-sulfur subunit [Bacteroidetes bacterium]|nr:ubiquinol-cytochrome c reductase iron-sulfur subunit [Bacteroidota bacterium]
MNKDNLNRRDFLKNSVKTVAFGGIILSTLDVKKLIASSENEISSDQTKVIKISDYPDLERNGGYAMINSKTIVIRTGTDKFTALSIVCSHKRCDVEYTGDGFECPCHGSAYSKTGKVINGPAKKNLKSYKTTYNADDNTLTINM